MAEQPEIITLADRIRGKMDIQVRLMGNNTLEISELLTGMENTITRLQVENEGFKATISVQSNTIKELKEELASL